MFKSISPKLLMAAAILALGAMPSSNVNAETVPLPENIEEQAPIEVGIGETAPPFVVPNVKGEDVSLAGALTKGPVVLSFYRGSWCPYCNDQLYSFQEILSEIEGEGAQLIAVSPEKPESGLDMALKKQLEFDVLHDDGNALAKTYDLLWEIPPEQREKLDEYLKGEYEKTLAEFNGTESYQLPVPATFVIDKDGTIEYMFKDPDYSKRADNQEILSILRRLKKERAE